MISLWTLWIFKLIKTPLIRSNFLYVCSCSLVHRPASRMGNILFIYSYYYTAFPSIPHLFGLRENKANLFFLIDASDIPLIANADCPLWLTLKSRLLNIACLWVLNPLSQVPQHCTASWCRQCLPPPPPLTRTNAHFESYNFSNGSSNLLNQTDVLVGIWKGSQALIQG